MVRRAGIKSVGRFATTSAGELLDCCLDLHDGRWGCVGRPGVSLALLARLTVSSRRKRAKTDVRQFVEPSGLPLSGAP